MKKIITILLIILMLAFSILLFSMAVLSIFKIYLIIEIGILDSEYDIGYLIGLITFFVICICLLYYLLKSIIKNIRNFSGHAK